MSLYLSMCSGCTAQYAIQGQPAGCELPGDNGYICPACTPPPPLVIPRVRSYRLRDGLRGPTWVVLAMLPGGMCEIRRIGFPDDRPMTVHVTSLAGAS